MTPQLMLGVVELMKANVAYALPGNAVQLSWQDPSGSTVQVSIDGVNYSTLGTGAANVVSSASTSAVFIKTSSTTTSIVAKSPPGIPGTITGSISTTGQFLAADGTASAPSYSFSAHPNTGIYYSSGLDFSISGNPSLRITSTQAWFASNYEFGWCSSNPDAAFPDTILVRDAANTLALRNSTNKNILNIYNTYTSASVYERLSIGFTTNSASILVNQLGSTDRSLIIGTPGTGSLFFNTNNVNSWQINSSGHLLAVADNTYDIGSAGVRPRNLFLSGGFDAGGAGTFNSIVAMPAGGASTSRLAFSSTTNFGIYWGSGAPSVSAPKGSLYLRTDGTTTNNRAYINTDGATTWTAITTVA